MKKTIFDIERMAADIAAEQEGIAQEAATIRAAIPAIEAEATAAAEAGNMAEFEAKQAILRDKEQRLKFLEIRGNKLKSTPAVDMEAAKEAWAGYAASYNKDLAKMQQEYDAQKKALLDLYRRMIDKQLDMIHQRDRFAGYVNANANMKTILFPANTIRYLSSGNTMYGLLNMGGTTMRDPDALFYLSALCAEAGTSPINSKNREFMKTEYVHTGSTLQTVIDGTRYE